MVFDGTFACFFRLVFGKFENQIENDYYEHGARVVRVRLMHFQWHLTDCYTSPFDGIAVELILMSAFSHEMRDRSGCTPLQLRNLLMLMWFSGFASLSLSRWLPLLTHQFACWRSTPSIAINGNSFEPFNLRHFMNFTFSELVAVCLCFR